MPIRRALLSKRAFEKAMVRMAADKCIRAECQEIAREFSVAEGDGLHLQADPPVLVSGIRIRRSGSDAVQGRGSVRKKK
jgi:hypothetical protein